MTYVFFILGAIIAIELIFCIINTCSGADLMYYVCRPFGIPFPMMIGLLIRIGLIVLAVILIRDGIARI